MGWERLPIFFTVFPPNEYFLGTLERPAPGVYFTTLPSMLIGLVCFLTIDEENNEKGSETDIR